MKKILTFIIILIISANLIAQNFVYITKQEKNIIFKAAEQ